MKPSGEFRALDPRLYPVAVAFVSAIRAAGVVVTVTSVVRSREKQAALYAAYRAGKSRYPALAPGHSLHERGLAWDMVVRPESLQRPIGLLWERIGGQWGGHAPVGYDPVHFQAKQFA